jgi:two-component system CheB/CheR fusion protein
VSAPESHARSSAAPRFAGFTVLVVEDHADSRAMLRQMLEALGARVLVAEDGQQALGLMAEDQADLILCDLLMPWMDGFTLIQRLRAVPRWRNARIIALTGLGYESDYQRTWEAGFDGHIVKPVDFETLSEALERYLPRPPRRAAGRPRRSSRPGSRRTPSDVRRSDGGLGG